MNHKPATKDEHAYAYAHGKMFHCEEKRSFGTRSKTTSRTRTKARDASTGVEHKGKRKWEQRTGREKETRTNG